MQQPKDLENLVNTGNLVQNFLPKQTDIDKMLKIIQCKALKCMHLTVTIKRDSGRIFSVVLILKIYIYYQ